MMGAWLGALLGAQGVPAEWRARLAAAERIHALTERLVARVA
jgi:hypothetical protein